MDSVRLVGGVSSNEGRVEIFHNGVWSSVCDEGWGLPDAEVVCRSLEYSRASRTLAGSWFGKGEGAGTVYVKLNQSLLSKVEPFTCNLA